LIFRAARSSDAHSGYHLPFHPLRIIFPIYGGGIYHSFHHMPQGFGSNFGGYRFWDWLMGTDAKYNQWLDKRSKVK